MAQIVVRNLDDDVKEALQRRAKQHGHSTEEEVRQILRASVMRDDVAISDTVGSRIAARFAVTGLTKEIPELRGASAQPAALDS